jgi:pentatricopeptide repeat protein
VKCGEADLAAEVAQQLRQEGFALERPVYHTMVEVFLKLGRWEDALWVLADMKAQVREEGGHITQ